MDIEHGNLADVDTTGTGWVVGYSPGTRTAADGGFDLRFLSQGSVSSGLGLKWAHHEASDDRGIEKPISEGRTLSILVSEHGAFRLRFAPTGEFAMGATQEFVLRRNGDFVIWGADIHHEWFVDAASTICTVRWTPVGAD